MAICDFCENPLTDAQYLLVKDVVCKSCPKFGTEYEIKDMIRRNC